MKIVIVGAGIGGLSAALCLAQAGHDIIVLERSAHLSDVGAGIQCGANAIKVLESLGLSTQLARVAVRPQRVDFRDFKTGRKLHTMELGDAYEAKYGAPYLHLHRSDLLQTLLAGIRQRPNIELRTGVSVSHYSQSDYEVSVHLQTAEQTTEKGEPLVKADLLVAADGIKSTIRPQLLGDSAPRFTGNVAWRGVVDTSSLPSNWMDTVVSNFVGPNKHMVLYYLRAKQLANFVGVVEDHQWTHSSWTSKASWNQLRDDFLGWHDTVDQIIQAVEKQSCYRWALFDHAPLSNWSSERVTLLGDAAHATLPFMASGAAMAIEDGRILQRSIDQAQDIPSALQLYQRNRLERTAKIQRTSAKAGKLYHFKTSLMRKAAFSGFKVLSVKQESFLPDYDANTVTLK